MRSFGIGLAAALIVAALSPAGAYAAKPPEGPPPVSAEARAAGMKAAPAIIAAGQYDCELTDARKLGEQVDPKTKVKTGYYEVACKANEGLVLAQTDGQPPSAYTCVETSQPRADGKPNTTACLLPGNANFNDALQPYVAKSGMPCSIDKVRPIGHNSTNSVFELSCKEGNGGYVLQTSAPPKHDQPVMMSPCVGFSENGNIHCELTPRAQQLAVVDKLIAASGKPCTVKADGRRYVGATASGKAYFEVACEQGKGYMIEQLASGALESATDCIDADGIGGGCTLTDTREAKTEQKNLYDRLAKAAGFNCNVSAYSPRPAVAGLPPHTEVVELTCSNRPDGAIAFFPASSTEKAQIYDCAHSELEGYRCGLSKASAAYGTLTAELVSFNKKSCTVSNARTVGVTPDKKGYTEVACADGLQGYMIEYELQPQLHMKSVIVCVEAKGIGDGCTLPGNVVKKG